MNVDVINHHMTPSADNVHGEILMFCMPGTMFHHKRISVVLSLSGGFYSTFNEFPGFDICSIQIRRAEF